MWEKPLCVLGWKIASRECKRPLLCCYSTVHMQAQDTAPWCPPCPGYGVSAPVCSSRTPSLQSLPITSVSALDVCVHTTVFWEQVWAIHLPNQSQNTYILYKSQPGAAARQDACIHTEDTEEPPLSFPPRRHPAAGAHRLPPHPARDLSLLPPRNEPLEGCNIRPGAARARHAGAGSAQGGHGLGPQRPAPLELPCRQCAIRRSGGERPAPPERGKLEARAPLERRRPRPAPPAPRRGKEDAPGAAGAERSPPEAAAPAAGGARWARGAAAGGAGAGGGAGGGRRGGGRRPPPVSGGLSRFTLSSPPSIAGAEPRLRRAGRRRERRGGCAERARERRGRGAGQWRDPPVPGPRFATRIPSSPGRSPTFPRTTSGK